MSEEAKKQQLIKEIEQERYRQSLISQIEFEREKSEPPGLLSQAGAAIGSVAKGVAEKIAPPVLSGLESIDAYTNAPIRAGLSAIQRGEGLSGAVKDFSNQYATRFNTGKNIEGILSGEEIASGFGASKEPIKWSTPVVRGDSVSLEPKEGISPAKALGFGIEMLGPELALGPLGAATRAAKSTKLGQAVVGAGSKAISTITNPASKAVAFVGETLTGIPRKSIETYIKRADEIDNLIKAQGGSIPAAVDNYRAQIQSEIQALRKSANKNIENALAALPDDPNIPLDSIYDSLNKSLQKVRPNVDPQDIELIKDLTARVDKISSGGNASVQDLQALKLRLSEIATGNAYDLNGKIFPSTNGLQRAARGAEYQITQLLNKMGPPELKEANKVLRDLHLIEKKTAFPRIFKEGSPDGPIFAAGSGENLRNQAVLRRIDKLTGKDTAVRGAENISTANQFNRPKGLSIDSTGKTATRLLVGGGAGATIGGPIGAILGSVATSPLAWKTAIKAGRIPIGLATRLAGGTATGIDELASASFAAMRTPQGREILENYILTGEDSNPISRRMIKQQ